MAIISQEPATDGNNNGQPSSDGESVPTLITEKPIVPTTSLHKLPKLALPTFCGDIREWQTFWDCYECAVHLNTSLSDVQKFTYLRLLVDGAAQSCIAGFQLTNANYTKAVELLQKRFGQQDKIADALMQGLIQLPSPSNDADCLQTFSDRMETSIRGLESLGQSEETYGDLLVPIVREKLPAAVRQAIARHHAGGRWKLHALRRATEREISVMREGDVHPVSASHMPIATFHTGSRTSRKSFTQNKNRQDFKRKVACHSEAA